MTHHRLVRIKRDWVPDWLFGLFCWNGPFPNWVVRPPLRQLLTREPTDIEVARARR